MKHSVTFKLSVEELTAIDAKASAAQCTRSAMIRVMLRGALTGVVLPMKFHRTPNVDGECRCRQCVEETKRKQRMEAALSSPAFQNAPNGAVIGVEIGPAPLCSGNEEVLAGVEIPK